jgi:hypothetical protein
MTRALAFLAALAAVIWLLHALTVWQCGGDAACVQYTEVPE